MQNYFLTSGLFWLLLSGPATAQPANLKTMPPDGRVRWLWLVSAKWGPDSVPALRRLDSVRAVARELNDERLLWYARLHRIMCRAVAEDHLHKPITAYAGTESYMEQCPVPLVRASYYCYYGQWQYKCRQFDKGLQYMLRARHMFGKIGYANIPEAIQYLNLFGNYYYKFEDYRKAVYYLEQAKNYPDDGLTRPYTDLNTLGMAYQRLNQWENAIRAFHRVVELAKHANEPIYVGIGSGNLGNTLRLAGKPRQALPYLYADLLINETKVPHSAALTSLYVAKALLALDSTTKAGRYIAHAQALGPDWIWSNYPINYYEVQAQYYRQTGDFRRASLYLDSTLLLTRRLRDELSSKILTNAEQSMNAGQYLSDIRQVETEKEFALLIRNLVAGALLVLLGLLGLSLAQYRTIRRANRQLSGQNHIITASSEQLTQQSEQLQTLLRELHHRVKNNLAIVSSLLNLQTYRLADRNRTGEPAGRSEAIEAVRESGRRVEAMSLIHQRLYRTDAITTGSPAAINMADYVTELAENLMAAYGYHADTFALSVCVSEPAVDVDIAIPLGLILNELLTNSFKYAFGPKQVADQLPALTIAFHRQADGPVLTVQDNGPGLDLEPWQNPDGDSGSFGRQLIYSLTEQIGGILQVSNRNGACFQLCIPQTI